MFSIFKKKIDPKKEILSEIKKLNFNDVETIIRLIRPTVLLDIKKGIPTIGSAKFGGCPDLQSQHEWPLFENKPMVFFCQISTKELSTFDCGFTFKKNGLLSFFHYFDEPDGDYGAEYDYAPSPQQFKILFTEDNTPLTRIEYPSDYCDDYKFDEKAIAFVQSYQIPGSPEHTAVINSRLTDDDKNKLYEYADRYMNIFESQIGGYPLPIQGGADLEWASTHWPNLEYLSSEFVDKALEFENLMSFSFQHDFETIGESNVYLGITKEDLENLNFKAVVVIHQAT